MADGALAPGTLIGNAVDVIEAGLGDLGGPALAVGASLVALRVSWVFARRLVMEGFSGSDSGSGDCGNSDCFHSRCVDARYYSREDRW